MINTTLGQGYPPRHNSDHLDGDASRFDSRQFLQRGRFITPDAITTTTDRSQGLNQIAPIPAMPRFGTAPWTVSGR